MKDRYNTIIKISEGLFKDRGSKFFSYLFPIANETEFKERLNHLKEEHPDARHHCFAYRLGSNGETYRTNDDGEPSGTAGKPIFNQLLSKDITNIGVVVVRYSSGTKLGTAGLINAYKEATIDAINNNNITLKTISNYYEIEHQYDQLSFIKSSSKKLNFEIVEQSFDVQCFTIISLGINETDFILSILKDNHKLKLTFLYTK